MGLDWNPLSRPKPGHEAEFLELLRVDLSTLSPEAQSTYRERFHAISEPPFATLGAPRIGFDAAADAWLAERLRASGREAELADVKRAMHGYYVLALLPPCAGLPVYSSRGYEGVDRYTFRGAFLQDVEDVIGTEMLERAWTTMTADELRAYGGELRAHARRFAAEHGVAELEHRYEALDDVDEDAPASKAHVLFSAAAWCMWWAERGHGLEPYY